MSSVIGSFGTTGGAGGSTPAISPNGRFVAFVSSAPDLVAGDTNNASEVFLYDADLDFFELHEQADILAALLRATR